MKTVTVITDDIWILIRKEYENTKISMAKLAKKYGTYAMEISRMNQAEKWKKYKPTSISVTIEKETHTLEPCFVNPFDILGETGTRKVKEIIKELGDTYSPVDEPLLISYAESYERYLRLVLIVNTQGEVVTSPKTGASYMNPSFSALQSVKSDMAKLGDRLGLSISSRKRLNLQIGQKEKTASLFDLIDDLDDDVVI